MKKFFRIEKEFNLEWNDIRSLLTVINVILVLKFGLSISWFTFGVAVLGVCKDLTVSRRINDLIMHSANVILNGYFLLMFYHIV